MPLGDLDENEVEIDRKTKAEGEKKKDTLEYHFAVNTSCHGLRNIATSRKIAVRIFWIIACLFAFLLLLSQIIMLGIQYGSYSAVTEIQHTHDQQLPYPAVTVCNYNRVMKTKLDTVAERVNVLPEDLQLYTTFGLADEPMLWDLKKEHAGQIERLLTIFRQVQQKLKEASLDNYMQLIQMLGYERKDLFVPKLPCKWSGKPMLRVEADGECPDAVFQEVITTFGRCYTFNAKHGGYLKQIRAGTGQGLTMWLTIQQNEYSEHLDFGNTQEGLKVLVHPSEQFPMVSSQGSAVKPGVHTYVSIEWTKYQNARPRWGTCVDTKLEYHKAYSSEACEKECYVRTIQTNCRCRPVSLPGDPNVPVCTPVDMLECVLPTEALYTTYSLTCKHDCGLACVQDEYDVRLSYADITSRHIERQLSLLVNTTQEYFRNNFICLDLFYPKMAYTYIHQKASTTFPQLLGNIGGQMGLFIGGSVLTLAELIEFLMMKGYFTFLPLYRRRKEQNRKKKKEAEDGTPTELTELKPKDPAGTVQVPVSKNGQE